GLPRDAGMDRVRRRGRLLRPRRMALQVVALPLIRVPNAAVPATEPWIDRVRLCPHCCMPPNAAAVQKLARSRPPSALRANENEQCPFLPGSAAARRLQPDQRGRFLARNPATEPDDSIGSKAECIFPVAFFRHDPRAGRPRTVK